MVIAERTLIMSANYLSYAETSKLIEHILRPIRGRRCRPSQWRDYALMLIMLDAGLRVGETVQLKQGDLTVAGSPVSLLTIRAEIAKTKQARDVPLTDRFQQAVKQLALYHWKRGPHFDHFYAFFTTNPRRHITVRQVQRIIGQAGQKALNRTITPHMLRHTFGTRILKRSNMRVTQKLLGHARITSTEIYTHPDADDMQDAIDRLSQPIIHSNSQKNSQFPE